MKTIDELREGFIRAKYVINEEALNIIYLALRLEKPLLVCGPTGVGKTELAKVLSKIFAAKFIRVQCHEGLDENKALYDWNFQRQLVKIHLAAKSGAITEEDLFSFANILQRPLLQAITSEEPVVLLVDEIDRADLNFEAFLLEVLSDFQISIPEVGTIKARRKPIVVITNNGEREISEALRRRCVFLYLDFPTIEQEASIIKAQAPEILEDLGEDIALGVNRLLQPDHHASSYPTSTLDWARALLLLNADRLQKDYVEKTLTLLAKRKESLEAYQDFLTKHRLELPYSENKIHF
ncbi:MAG: MoxR family ATPase [Bacillota bacterium]|jgi:MoxR-like ATPase|nr:MoxR family ATPase [Bacillota bacterium]